MVRERAARGTVQGWILPHLIAWVQSGGFDVSPLRNLLASFRLDDPDLRVPEATAEAAWELAATISRDTALGIHVAESLPRGSMDLVEYAFRASPSLGVGLWRLARYGRILSDRAATGMRDDGDSLHFWVRDAGTTPLHPARSEFGLALALKLARDGTGAHVVPLQVCFIHPRPRDVSEHEHFFSAPVRFGAGSISLTLGEADGDRSLLDADPALVEIVRRRLDKLLLTYERVDTASVAARVRRIIVDSLGQRTISAEEMARTLRLSRRTLTRRLAEENTSFARVFESVREEFARMLLQDSNLSIADIAFFVQYSEPAAFHRSFRRWTGLTPRQYRDTNPTGEAVSA